MPSSTSSSPERPGEPASRFLPGPRPRRIAHRGLALEAPENTLEAFRAALDAGADMLETDTRATRDRLAAEGEALIDELVRRMDMPHVVDQMRKLEAYNDAVAAANPWMPSAGKKKV